MSSKSSKRRQKRCNTADEDGEVDSKKSVTPVKKVDEDVSVVIIDDVEETSNKEGANGLKGFEIAAETNGDVKNGEDTNSQGDAVEVNEEIEPLVLESDVDSPTSQEDCAKAEDTSPVLSSRNKRGNNRSTPTPTLSLSPKHTEEECSYDVNMYNDVRVNVVRLDVPEVVAADEVSSDQMEDAVESSEKQEDVTNASIFVNFGDDTKNMEDITTTSIVEDDYVETQSFAETTKDMSYGETLRSLSGRKPLRLQNSDSFRHSRFVKTDSTDGSRKSYVPHISGVKRKTHGDLPEEKRFKGEEVSPGLLSYISSPINTFKSRVSGRSEIPSSTPKLTSYKLKHSTTNNVVEEMNKIDLDEQKSEDEKKWCLIM